LLGAFDDAISAERIGRRGIGRESSGELGPVDLCAISDSTSDSSVRVGKDLTVDDSVGSNDVSIGGEDGSKDADSSNVDRSSLEEVEEDDVLQGLELR